MAEYDGDAPERTLYPDADYARDLPESPLLEIFDSKISAGPTGLRVPGR